MIMDDVEVITVKMIPKIVKRTTASEERLTKELGRAMRVFGVACWLCGCLIGAGVVIVFIEVWR